MKTTFETYLKNVTSILFNPATLGRRVAAVQERLKPEVAWDRNITQRSPGINYHWTYQQFLDNINQPVSGVGGGGAQWGLMQWVDAKSQVVAKEFALTLATQPVDPPTNINGAAVLSSSSSGNSSPTALSSSPSATGSTASFHSAGNSIGASSLFVLSSAIISTVLAKLIIGY